MCKSVLLLKAVKVLFPSGARPASPVPCSPLGRRLGTAVAVTLRGLLASSRWGQGGGPAPLVPRDAHGPVTMSLQEDREAPAPAGRQLTSFCRDPLNPCLSGGQWARRPQNVKGRFQSLRKFRIWGRKVWPADERRGRLSGGPRPRPRAARARRGLSERGWRGDGWSPGAGRRGWPGGPRAAGHEADLDEGQSPPR